MAAAAMAAAFAAATLAASADSRRAAATLVGVLVGVGRGEFSCTAAFAVRVCMHILCVSFRKTPTVAEVTPTGVTPTRDHSSYINHSKLHEKKSRASPTPVEPPTRPS